MMRKLLLLLILAVFSPNLNAQEINWMTMNEALELQKEKPKKIFVDAYTVWCGPCKMLDKYTFTNKDVVNYINEHFYAVKFNAEGNELIKYKEKTFSNPNFDPEKAKSRNGIHQFAQAMGVSAYPTMVFFDEKGNFISPIKGYLKPEQLEIFLKVFASDEYKKMTTQEAWQEYRENFKGSFSS